ncbi:LOW QUALITY PROTEIN: farnesyl pyrophosphate synthase [Drosophila sulfurigaster albostrigata]|uniref:Farnesyl pyrophosphate synthase n=1 Tax=Drosophila albomicans TaxID=7291 RepID=A0A6P8WZ82_DROAB|nr:farnesyl pyrophosphate synthase [Drosophila albomicans]XP_062132157.1 LOW QUALITY PROTEIN: farnesyl pyrophosphate synthase [Drosophila sulfurigaster albostrigata]
MFKLAQKFLPQQRLFNASNIAIRRMISTSDEVKSVDTIGGLPTEIVNEQKLKKTTRALSTLQNHSVPIAARVTVSKDESRDFMAVFPDVVRDLTNATKAYNCNDAAKWFAKALQYNVPRGKKNRGILTVLTYKNLVQPQDLTPENIKLAQYLGWCVEMLQSFFIMSDDVMDNSTTRRGQTCWHKVENVGLTAINDALMIENAIYLLLKQHFSHLECYVPLLELFHEISFITTCGQSLDLLNSYKSVADFTMENYKAIVDNKTAYYTFYLPFAIAMHLAGYTDPEAFRQTKSIVLEMGHFFQVQDDFLDCFGNPEITGKVGTDIQDNKCSWLAVVAMQRANAEQKQIMIDCYGKSDPAKVDRVKELYKELSLPSTYATFEEESYNMIKTHIQQTSRGVPHITFLQILNKIYQRDA